MPITGSPLEIQIDEGEGPLVVLLHGFPEQPNCWQNQVGPLVEAGYRVLAPALRGYAGSPAPSEISAYTMDKLANDIAGVIEATGETEAVVVGHDWGASVAWATAGLRPERVRAVCCLSVPFTARSKSPPIERLAALFGDQFFYMVYFQQPAVPEAELGADPRDFLVRMYQASSGDPLPGSIGAQPLTAHFLDQLPPVATLPPFLDEAAVAANAAAFAKTGFTGPLNYYRAMDTSWAEVPTLATEAHAVTMPAAFIAGEKDLVLAFTPKAGMAPPLVTDLRLDVTIPGAGHWVQQEAPVETTAALLEFLGTL